MKTRLAAACAFACVLASLAGCKSYEPLWATNELTVPVIGSITESLSTSSLSVQQGGSSTLTVTLTPADGFSGLVQFAPVGAQSGVLLSPESVDLSGPDPVLVAMTISAAADATAGTRNITIAVASSNQAAEATLALTVTAAQ